MVSSNHPDNGIISLINIKFNMVLQEVNMILVFT